MGSHLSPTLSHTFTRKILACPFWTTESIVTELCILFQSAASLVHNTTVVQNSHVSMTLAAKCVRADFQLIAIERRFLYDGGIEKTMLLNTKRELA